MSTRFLALLLATFAIAAGGCGGTAMSSRIMKATAILDDIQSSKNAAPASTLQNCAGVVILGEVKAGVGIGGSGGEGILLRRLANGWSNPVAVSIGSGTIGLQLGAQGRNMLIVFNTDAGVMKFASEGAGMIAAAQGTAASESGGAASVTGKPAATQIFTTAEGLYGGADIGAFNVQVDKKVNEETYGPTITTMDLLEGRGGSGPAGMSRIERKLDGK